MSRFNEDRLVYDSLSGIVYGEGGRRALYRHSLECPNAPWNIDKTYGHYDPRFNAGLTSSGMRGVHGPGRRRRRPLHGSRKIRGGSHDGSDLDDPDDRSGSIQDHMSESIRRGHERQRRMGDGPGGPHLAPNGFRHPREFSPPRPDGLPPGRDRRRGGQHDLSDFDSLDDPIRGGPGTGRGRSGGRGRTRRRGMAGERHPMMGTGYPPMRPGMARMGDGSQRPRLPFDDAFDERERWMKTLPNSGWE